MSGTMIGGEHALPRKRERRPAAFGPARSGEREWVVPPAWVLTAAIAVGYLIAAPASPDLAAASYRSDLFSRVGFSLWDNSWYAGHHLPAYSVFAPALGALIGPRLLAAVTVTVSVVLFERLIAGRFSVRAARISAFSFALGAGVALFSSRVPYDLGFALGLGALVLCSGGRWRAAFVLCVLCSLTSPVAGAFLALALLAVALGSRERRRPLLLIAATAAPILVLTVAFPEGGTQPFVPSSFFPAFAGALVIALLLARDHRVLFTGLLLYALMLLGAYVVSSPFGGNAGRLGALIGAPLAALLLADPGSDAVGDRPARHDWLRRPWVFAAFMVVLTYWQVQAPLNDLAAVDDNASVDSSYYAPLLAELHRLDVGYGARPARVELVPTSSHWEARWVAPHVMIARGWERQLDQERNEIFYADQALTAASYRAWLLEQSVSLIALPDAPLDYSGNTEAKLLRTRPPAYLHEVWRSRHWRLFAVSGPRPLLDEPGVTSSIGQDSATLWLPRPGSYTLRVHFTPYWALTAGVGCVARAAGDWTRVTATHPGRFVLGVRFSLARVFSHGPRCR
jgi:hypothetical protein